MHGRPASMGGVRTVDHAYFLSADVSQFEAPDVVVTANNRHITIHAEKVCVCVSAKKVCISKHTKIPFFSSVKTFIHVSLCSFF